METELNITESEDMIQITPAAVKEAKRLIGMEAKSNLFLKLGVSTGGCSGLSYALTFEDKPSGSDLEYDFEGLKVRVDLKDLKYLKGSELDYKGGLLGGGFKFSNPNAKRSCGCGTSFTC